tara:strand:- start:996 stop:1244 length:249 start_codon:yes stop_codon:yes gene_type:complete
MMLLEKQSNMLKQIGPFERAKTNLDKFVWNFMIFYTTVTVAKAWQAVEEEKLESAETIEMTAELTIRGVFQLILEKDNGVWN